MSPDGFQRRYLTSSARERKAVADAVFEKEALSGLVERLSALHAVDTEDGIGPRFEDEGNHVERPLPDSVVLHSQDLFDARVTLRHRFAVWLRIWRYRLGRRPPEGR